jgi:hypothetical protein
MENIDKEKLLEAANNITNPVKQKEEIYMLMDTLGLSYRRTNCGRCLKDYLNMVKEELGVIADASEESGWDGEWVYLCKHAQTWNGHIIDQDTDPKVIEQFVKRFPVGYYKRVSK